MRVVRSEFDAIVFDAKVVALGHRLAPAYTSLKDFINMFGNLSFINERKYSSVDEVVTEISKTKANLLIMPNPYGNARRLHVYKRLRDINFPIIVFDRGGLPGSWFFDQGFNADSPSYSPLEWDHPLSKSEQKRVDKYISKLKVQATALEAQSNAIGGDALRELLGLNNKKVLFVPFQRPGDTTIKYFSGSVSDMNDFSAQISKISLKLKELDDDWVVIGKKHPLEEETIPTKGVHFVSPDTHINDLLACSDAVCLVNSGVGLLASLWDKPVYHFGETYYSHPKLNRRVNKADDVVHALLFCELTPDPETRDRFVNYLFSKVYSFGNFHTELVREGNTFRNVTRSIDFDSVNIPYSKYLFNKKRILFVSPVIPYPINKGSALRTDQMLRLLINAGYLVDLVVLNVNEPKSTSKSIECRLSKHYPDLVDVTVRKHAKKGSVAARIRNEILGVKDRVKGVNDEITNNAQVPFNLQRAIKQKLSQGAYEYIFVNYLKMIKAVPQNMLNTVVVDIHDFQTNRIINDVLPKLKQSKQKDYLKRFKESEIYWLGNVRKVLSISSIETKEITSVIPDIDILTVPAACPANYNSLKPTRDADRFNAAFIGSNSEGNIKSILWFIEEVMALILKKHSNFKLLIQGAITKNSRLYRNDTVIQYVSNHSLVLSGFVEDISDVYAQADFIICPIVSGSGMKIKVVEALAHAKAVVATPIALEGYSLRNNVDVLKAATASEFSESINRLLTEEGLICKLSKNAQQTHKRKYDVLSSTKLLERFLNNV
ncbi:MAG: glycosyltransferase involved in cell wall biosynthesis [Gammaproteobacteria bacterium]|jgi:glycosyltransferase involved in cell wall biosynthesis